MDFIVSFAAHPRHNFPVIGAFLNALGILIGGLVGLTVRSPLSVRTQNFFKILLGIGTVAVGLRLVAMNLHGTFSEAGKQLFFGFVAVVVGFWLGKLLRLQKLSNRAGHYAGQLLAAAQKNRQAKPLMA